MDSDLSIEKNKSKGKLHGVTWIPAYFEIFENKSSQPSVSFIHKETSVDFICS